jgi:hypothetical protein
MLCDRLRLVKLKAVNGQGFALMASPQQSLRWAKVEALGQKGNNMLPEEFTKYSNIIVNRIPSPLHGKDILSFDWEGSPKDPTKVKWHDQDLLDHPNFPFKLRLIRYDVLSGTKTYIRTDVSVNIKTIQFLENRWLQHCKAFNYFQAQIIMTLHIWGLAYVDCYEIPSWACVGKKTINGTLR